MKKPRINEGWVHRANAYGDPEPKCLLGVDPRYFDQDSPAHSDPKIEVEIIIWMLGYSDTARVAVALRAGVGQP